MVLYTYFRSSASYRVRIALNLKGIPYEPRFVHLQRGEQRLPGHLSLNAQGLVPVLIDDGRVLTQSLAIIEYLEETRPRPPLLPVDPAGRARVRALANAVACEIHPLNNLRVLNYITTDLRQPEADRLAWYRHWIAEGFEALEKMLRPPETAAYCHGESPTMADACLVPQVYNALRFNCDLSVYPTVRRIYESCMALEAFQSASPERQPDTEPPKS
jgi:maleylacetoacetate isomerase